MVRDANRYLAEQEPWKIKDDPVRQGTILHVALQVVDDAKTLLTPFLPNSSNKIHEMLGGQGVWSGMPEIREVDELAAGVPTRSSPATTTTAAPLGAPPIRSGTPLAPPKPLFAKLDPKIVDEELARLEDK